MADTNYLAVDVRLIREGDDDVKNTAVALFLLHERAKKQWGDRSFRQAVGIKNHVLTVELFAEPENTDG